VLPAGTPAGRRPWRRCTGGQQRLGRGQLPALACRWASLHWAQGGGVVFCCAANVFAWNGGRGGRAPYASSCSGRLPHHPHFCSARIDPPSFLSSASRAQEFVLPALPFPALPFPSQTCLHILARSLAQRARQPPHPLWTRSQHLWAGCCRTRARGYPPRQRPAIQGWQTRPPPQPVVLERLLPAPCPPHRTTGRVPA
jgi:hypothetical protein